MGITSLLYADDLGFLDDTPATLQTLLDAL